MANDLVKSEKLIDFFKNNQNRPGTCLETGHVDCKITQVVSKYGKYQIHYLATDDGWFYYYVFLAGEFLYPCGWVSKYSTLDWLVYVRPGCVDNLQGTLQEAKDQKYKNNIPSSYCDDPQLGATKIIDFAESRLKLFLKD